MIILNYFWQAYLGKGGEGEAGVEVFLGRLDGCEWRIKTHLLKDTNTKTTMSPVNCTI